MTNLCAKILAACFAAAGLLLLGGCESANASFFPLDSAQVRSYGAPKNPQDVEIFITNKPTYKYREVGILTYETFSSYNDESAVYRILRERAAKLGLDGIIIMNAQEFRSPFLYQGRRGRAYARYRDVYFYDSPDMFRYRAMGIVKVK